MNEFEGRIAVVTGGSEGIGRRLTLDLTALGAEVYFCSRHAPAAEEVLRQCRGRGHFTACDVGVVDATREFIAGVVAEAGRIDYLVNNVAFDGRNRFEDLTPEDFDRFVRVNLRSAVMVSRLALPALRRGAGKAIVNLGTTNWMLGLEPFTLYSSTKAGLLGFTRALARELGPEGIRVNMVSPGWVMTARQLERYVSEQDKAALLRDQALPFLLTEKDITPAVRFLLSSEASAITGQNLIVDGGKHMQ